MTTTQTPQAEPETEPEFDRHRVAAELRLATKGDDAWFSDIMSEETFVAVGRKDGAANVLVTARGWQVQDLTDGKIRVTTFDTAEDAVEAAKAVEA